MSEYRTRKSLEEVLRKIAWEVDNAVVPAGDLAELRRAAPGDLGGPALWKLSARHLEPAGLMAPTEGRKRQAQERAWATLLAAVAKGVPNRQVSLGKAMADSGISEARLLRLLKAHRQALLDGAHAVAHQLGTKGQGFNWADLAQLLLSDEAPWENEARRRIALDYYRRDLGHASQDKEEVT